MRTSTAWVCAFVAVVTLAASAKADDAPDSGTRYAADAVHVVVHFEQGRYCGWPANHGIWSWGDEILVGFSRCHYQDQGFGPVREAGMTHPIDREKPEDHLLARSRDGGHTWTLEFPNEKGYLLPEGRGLHGTELPGVELKPWDELEAPIDFTHPGLAFTLRQRWHKGDFSRFYYSYDRGYNWHGPYRLPDFGQTGVMARTDYVIDGPRGMMAFLTAEKSSGGEGRPFAARTADGGVTWKFVSWIMEEPEGFAIMPATVRLPDHRLLTAIREREPQTGDSWLSVFRSADNGGSWESLGELARTGIGNPASLTLLPDGRVVAVYGYRALRWGIRAKLSADNGETWGEEIILRDDGRDRDIGYPRSVLRPDGKIVTVYYYNDEKTGPERYIAATIWDPDAIQAR